MQGCMPLYNSFKRQRVILNFILSWTSSELRQNKGENMQCDAVTSHKPPYNFHIKRFWNTYWLLFILISFFVITLKIVYVFSSFSYDKKKWIQLNTNWFSLCRSELCSFKNGLRQNGKPRSGEFKCDFFFFGKHWCNVLQTKEERAHQLVVSSTVQEPAFLMALGCIRPQGVGSFSIQGSINDEVRRSFT